MCFLWGAFAGPLLFLMIATYNVFILGVCLFFNSLLGIMFSVLVATLRQTITPSHLAGRVASVQAFIAMGLAMPGGALFGGAVAALCGVRAVFVFSGVLCVLLYIGTAWILRPRVLRRHVEQLAAKSE